MSNDEVTRHVAYFDDEGNQVPEMVDPLTVYIVLEIGGGREAVDGVHLDEAAAIKRRDELNLRADDLASACVVPKYVRTESGYLTRGEVR